MPGHGGDELGVRLVAGEAELLDVRVLGAEHVLGTEAEELQDVADLGLGQRLLDVVAVAVLDALFVQQGDRLAAGASSTGADEVDHGSSSSGAVESAGILSPLWPEPFPSHPQVSTSFRWTRSSTMSSRSGIVLLPNLVR